MTSITTTKSTLPIYWAYVEQEEWKFVLAATDQGLCYIGSPHKPYEEMEAWIQARRCGSILIQDDQKLQPYIEEVREYLRGERQQFTVAHDFQGTPFQVEVWQALMTIPYGHTCSYSDIAHQIGRPAAVRAIGAAIGANPFLITIPCHRVIGKNGALTGYRGGMEMKTTLLDLEKRTVSSSSQEELSFES